MSHRNKIVIESPESKALKELRLKAGLGVRKLAERMNYSHTRVHQMESGRDEISDEYIQFFLDATGFSWKDWQNEIMGSDPFKVLRDKCHDALDSVEPNKLKMILELLINL